MHRFNNGRFYLLVDGDEGVVRASPLLVGAAPQPQGGRRPALCLSHPAPHRLCLTAARPCLDLGPGHRHLAQEPWKMTKNQELNTLHVRNATAFVASTRHAVVPGDTLLADFIFFLHPVRLGAAS